MPSVPWKWILPSSLLVVLIAWLVENPKEGNGKVDNMPPVEDEVLSPAQKTQQRQQQQQQQQPESTATSTSTSHEHAAGSVYVIGDLHGDVHCARYWVNRTGLVSLETGEWIASHDEDRLVFVGDYVDKGPTSKQTMEFVKSLTDKFPSKVTALMGNHEMELLLDRDKRRHEVWGGMAYYQLAFSSIHPGEWLNYLTEQERREPEDEIVVEALYNASIEVYGEGRHREVIHTPEEMDASILNYIKPEFKELVQERLRVYQKRYMDSFRSGTELGTWLEQRPVVALVQGTLFVHGGISSAAAQLLQKHPPPLGTGSSNSGIQYVNEQLAMHAHEDKLLDFIQGTHTGKVVYNMLTFRGNHNRRKACPFLPQLLPPGAQRLAVGHTPDDSVRLLCGNQFLAVDSALGRWFRNSGNDYCPGHVPQASSNGRYACDKMNDQCQGQIVQIVGNKHIQIMDASSS